MDGMNVFQRFGLMEYGTVEFMGSWSARVTVCLRFTFPADQGRRTSLSSGESLCGGLSFTWLWFAYF
jgi:hypothetical protein